jgi:hypothetical protein
MNKADQWASGRGQLLHLRVLRLGLVEDGDIGVGVLPKREEILIGRACFSGVPLHYVSAGHTDTCQSTNGVVEYNTSVIKNLLKLRHGLDRLTSREIRLASRDYLGLHIQEPDFGSDGDQ